MIVQDAPVTVQDALAAGKSVPSGLSGTNAVLVTASGARVTAIGAIAANVATGHGAPTAEPGTSVAARTATSGSVVAGRVSSGRDATAEQIRLRPRGPVTTGPGDRRTAATVRRVVTVTSDGLRVLKAAADRDPIQQRQAMARSASTSQKASRPTS